MRFLVDRCAGRRLAEALSARGHEVLCRYEPDLTAGAIVTVRRGRVRVTRPPFPTTTPEGPTP